MTVLISNDGAVRTFTLHRPEALNALTPALLEELSAGLAEAAADDTPEAAQEPAADDTTDAEPAADER